MDPSGHYPDPLGEALSHSSQRAAQIASLATAAAEVALRRKALHGTRNAERDRRALGALRDQQRAAGQQAKAGWAPAHDPRWLAQADLVQTARAWGAAAGYADADPAAASAMRKCEERLRTLHPYAMARYDRLRSEGASAPDAMRATAPLFAREPHVRTGQPATERGILTPPAGQDVTPPGDGTDETSAQSSPGPEPEPEPEPRQELRGRQIVQRLQARTLAARGSELSPDELVSVLGATTSLPGDLIAQLARAASEERLTAAMERARTSDLGSGTGAAAVPGGQKLTAVRRDTLIADTVAAHTSPDRTAAQLAAESFPCTAADAVKVATTTGPTEPTQSPVRSVAIQNTKRRGRSE